MKNIVQFLGPTGTGKTDTTLDLCRQIGGEVISADSVQVYRGFDIGSDKINEDQMQNIPHHLIDILEPHVQFNASVFLNLSWQKAEEINSRGNIPVVCGGTALYHRVMINGLFEDKGEVRISRDKLDRLADSLGIDRLWKRVKEIDPVYADTITSSDRKRILRALQIYYNNAVIPSNLSDKNVTPFKEWNFIRVGLKRDRQELYRRIEKRVDQMMDRGLIDEVEKLLNRYPQDSPPFQAIGYREIAQYLNGEYTLEQAVDKVKQHTRNFAKRQLSWYRQETDIKWFTPDESGQIAEFVKKSIR